jgi:hypothetical protein
MLVFILICIVMERCGEREAGYGLSNHIRQTDIRTPYLAPPQN